MTLFIPTWSVTSAFNRWKDSGVHGDSTVSIHQDALLIRERFGLVDTVADVISGLGYTVKCGVHQCERAMGSYIIMNIQSEDGTYVYGCSQEDEEWLGQRTNVRPLIGNRTLWEWVQWQSFKEIKTEEELQDVISEKDIIDVIYSGGKYLLENSQVPSFYLDRAAARPPKMEDANPDYISLWHSSAGISTIGNTLPHDIVKALYNFSHHDIAFRKDIHWEYFIPDLIQIPEACPVAEQNDAVVEDLVSGVSCLAKPSSECNNETDSCSSDDGE